MRLRPCGLALALALGALRASAAPFSAAANVAGLALLGWNASGPSITFRVSGALPSYVRSLAPRLDRPLLVPLNPHAAFAPAVRCAADAVARAVRRDGRRRGGAFCVTVVP